MIRLKGRTEVARRWETRTSLLFKQEYLVVFLDDHFFYEISEGCDALAASMLEPNTPPLVLVPLRSARKRTERFRTILEHEYVHINQALLGLFAPTEVLRTSDSLLRYLFFKTQIEYEAYLIQLTRWPRFYKPVRDVSLDRSCVLQGYTLALEEIFTMSVTDRIPRREVTRFMDTLSSSIPDGFRRIGIGQVESHWFQQQTAIFLGIALNRVAEERPALSKVSSYTALLKHWLKVHSGR